MHVMVTIINLREPDDLFLLKTGEQSDGERRHSQNRTIRVDKKLKELCQVS